MGGWRVQPVKHDIERFASAQECRFVYNVAYKLVATKGDD